MPEGYKDFVAGTGLAAADLESYCELQGIMRFASAAARDTALTTVKSEGMFAYLLDVNTLTVYSGAAWSTIGPVHGAWTTYVPVWTSSGTAVSAGNAAISGRYMRVGRMVTAHVTWTWGSTSTFGTGNYSFSLPVAANAFGGHGSGVHIRSGAAAWYGLTTYAMDGASSFGMMLGGATANQFYGQALPVAQGTGDAGFATITYEAAADA